MLRVALEINIIKAEEEKEEKRDSIRGISFISNKRACLSINYIRT
jgi:hypothetical protein